MFTPPVQLRLRGRRPHERARLRPALLPGGVRLNAIFASDIGHWDVPDMREVLPEAWELVEDGHLDEDEFRAFTFANAVRTADRGQPRLLSGHPAVEVEVDKLLASG